jgi:hypothetical protein
MEIRETVINILNTLNADKNIVWDDFNASQLGSILKTDILKLIKDLIAEELKDLTGNL